MICLKIGIFGGSFNPPHNMHKKIGLELIEKGYLDKVIYVPTGDKYQKKDLIDATKRYEMIRLMIENSDDLSVSDYEIKNRLTYTYQTLSHFNQLYPKDEIYFICGSDNLLELDTWNNYQYILDKYKILVIKRGEERKEEIVDKYPNVIETDITMSDLSSTKIRKLIKEERIEELGTKMDSSVIEYIQQKKLYRE